jgi:ketosteroid isomerase-like protein
MSANVDLVRSIYSGWEGGDFSSTDWAHPEIEHVVADGPLPGTWKGLDAMREATRERFSAGEDVRIEAKDYRELDGERVLVLSHFSGRGKSSGLELAEVRPKGAEVFHIRGGKVTRLVAYWDRERAFADLGLASETDSSHS